jgi:hypothetical protein
MPTRAPKPTPRKRERVDAGIQTRDDRAMARMQVVDGDGHIM